MPRTPRPFEVAQELTSIRPAMLQRLTVNYRAAYQIGYSRGRSGDPVGAFRKGASTGDPTGDTVADKEKLRAKVAFAAAKIQEAGKALDAADDALSFMTERAGPYERLDNRLRGAVLYPEEVQAGKRAMRRMVGRKSRARS